MSFGLLKSISFWLMQLFAEGVDLLLRAFFNLVATVGLDNNRMLKLFPELKDLTTYLQTAGMAIVFIIFTISLFEMLMPFSGFDPPADNHFQLVLRCIVAAMLVWNFEKFFMDVMYNGVFNSIFSDLSVGLEKITTFSGDTLASRLSSRIDTEAEVLKNSGNDVFASIILVLILGLMLVFNCFKFIVFHFEKLFFSQFLIYCSPVACCTIASKKTESIFKNYINLIFTNCISLIMNLIIIRLVADGFKTANANAIQAFTTTTGLVDSFKMDMTGSYFVDMLLIISVLKVGKKMSVYVGQLFQLNGMSDSVRDGLGAMTFAAGAMFRTGTSMLGKSGDNKVKEDGKGSVTETTSVSDKTPEKPNKDEKNPTTDIKQEKNQGVENGEITDLSNVERLENIGADSNDTDAVDLEKIESPAPATDTSDYSYEQAKTAIDNIAWNTGYTSTKAQTELDADIKKTDNILGLFNGKSNDTASPDNYKRKD